MLGQVYKIHSDFYYVKFQDKTDVLVECKLREVLKKQKIKIRVGDFVEVQDSCAIAALLDRKNELERPAVSNLDFMLVVSSFLEPNLDFIQLNRYLTFLKYNKIPAILCFNKEDLLDEKALLAAKNEIISIYKPLGYKIVFTSAAKNTGFLELKKMIKNKTVAFCGASGVGKSSIVNSIKEKTLQKTGDVSKKTKRGCHTTRHSQIIEFGNIKIMDTPGFSKLTFDFMLPSELTELFLDIKKFACGCKYANCLHKNGEDCNVIKNLDKINPLRYESYLKFLEETKIYKERLSTEGNKKEETSKTFLKRNFTKISSKKRMPSRKKLNQTIGNEND